MLNAQYLTDDGALSDTHKYGTAFFMVGCVAYSMLLLYIIRKRILMAVFQTDGCGLESIISACVLCFYGTVFSIWCHLFDSNCEWSVWCMGV